MTKISTTKSEQDIPELKRKQLGAGVCGKYLKHVGQGKLTSTKRTTHKQLA